MKITGIETKVVNAEMRNWIFVKVLTDEDGLFGWGEATLEWKTQAVVGAIADLEPLLIGRDPRDIAQAVQAMIKQSFWRLGAIGMTAVSGIEMALWDIFGKHLDLPVWRLLGGKVRDKVAVYTHLGMGDMRAVYETETVSQLVDRASALLDEGYRALKAVNIPYTHYHAPRAAQRHVENMFAALRECVGDDVEIMVDFHGRPASASAAMAYIDALAACNPMFVEEPVQPGDLDGLRRISARTSIPLATGERLTSLKEFSDLIESGVVDVVQPDICHCGGLMAAKKIAAFAEARGIGVAPHNPLGPIAGAAALHFAVSTPNHIIQEEMVGAVPWYFDVVQGPIERIDGFWQVPETPGLGINVDEVACAKHPYVPEVQHTKHATLEDGTIVDW